MAHTLPKRSEIPRAHTWDAESVFPSDEAWESEIRSVADTLPELERFRDRLGSSADVLAEWLETSERLYARAGRVSVYAGMFYAVDANDQTAAARMGRVMSLGARIRAAAAFAEPEILAIPAETLAAWTAAHPHLETYRHYFDVLGRRREHIRSAEVEEVLGQAADPFAAARQIHGTLANADLTFAPARDSHDAEFEIAQGSLGGLLHSRDRALRQTAWEQYADAFLAHKNTMANCLSAGVKQDVFYAKARRYGSALEAALTPNHIPIRVFHNLIATFRKHLPTWHRYWAIRKQALGYDTLHVYDITAPLSEHPPVVPYSQAVDWIAEGMLPLGEAYVTALRRGATEERWVDIYPNRGKRQGAFSSGTRGTNPFIFLSYEDDLFGVSTLAHEFGHSLHSYLTWRHQPQVYAGYGLFAAEVASNFNQALVRAYLLRTQSDRDFQIAVLEEAMANFHRYFFIMPTLARFELEIHERVERGESLTADSLIALMTDLFREGYGDGVEVDAERVGITWAQFSTHLYSNFYVYQYATGIAGANALAAGVLTEGPAAAERYLDFLKSGGSRYPLDALRLAGVDLESPEPVERAFGVFAEYVDRLGALLGVGGELSL